MSNETSPTPPSSGSGGTPAACTTTACPDPSKYGKAITIEGDDDFKKKTRQCLDAINKTPTGAKMIKSIEDSGKKVTFKETSQGNSAQAKSSKAKRKADGSPGDGSSSTVKYNPTKTQIGDGSEPWMKRPPCVGLAHELVHVYHSANGTGDFPPKSEDMAVGVPPYDTEPVTENKIRDEWTPKQPQRPRY